MKKEPHQEKDDGYSDQSPKLDHNYVKDKRGKFMSCSFFFSSSLFIRVRVTKRANYLKVSLIHLVKTTLLKWVLVKPTLLRMQGFI